MRKITMALAATAFVLGSMTLASAQTQVPGAASIRAQATPAMMAAADPVMSGWAMPPTVASCFMDRGRDLWLSAGKQRRRSSPGDLLLHAPNRTSFCEL